MEEPPKKNKLHKITISLGAGSIGALSIFNQDLALSILTKIIEHGPNLIVPLAIIVVGMLSRRGITDAIDRINKTLGEDLKMQGERLDRVEARVDAFERSQAPPAGEQDRYQRNKGGI